VTKACEYGKERSWFIKVLEFLGINIRPETPNLIFRAF